MSNKEAFSSGVTFVKPNFSALHLCSRRCFLCGRLLSWTSHYDTLCLIWNFDAPLGRQKILRKNLEVFRRSVKTRTQASKSIRLQRASLEMLQFILFAALLLLVSADPAAYAICQAACASGCLLTTPVGFIPCYATCQSGCAALLVVPGPSCVIS